MNTYSRSHAPSIARTEAVAAFMSKVYTWMTGGILLTAVVASYIGNTPELVFNLLQNRILFYGLLIAQVGVVIGLSAAMQRLTAGMASLLYLVYAALTGVTLSVIFLIYTRDSIASVFFTTACGFGGLSLLGYTTKRDLGPVGAFCGMALFGLIGWALLSWIFPSMMGGQAQTVYSILGVLVFAGLTAYDTQKIKAIGFEVSGQGELSGAAHKAAIFGALSLYLDFINLFLNLLRLVGDRRR